MTVQILSTLGPSSLKKGTVQTLAKKGVDFSRKVFCKVICLDKFPQ